MIDDRELLLFYYRDGLSSRRIRWIEKRLEQDPALRLRLQRLDAELDALRPAQARASVPVHRRWRAALTDAMAERDHPGGADWALPSAPWQPRFEIRPLFAPVLAAAVLLSVGVFIGTRLPPPAVHAPTDQVATQPGVSPAPATVNAMRAYLMETERRLVELDDVDTVGRAEVITEIQQRNALYVKAAERADWPELARVLRAFDLALNTLQDDSSAGGSGRQMRSQLEFELKVMQTRIDRHASNLAHPI